MNRSKALTSSFFILLALALLSLAPWLFITFLSFFAFDAPGSESDPWTWAFVIPLWGYPLVVVAGCVIGGILHGRQRQTAAVTVMALPLVYAILYLVVLLIAGGVQEYRSAQRAEGLSPLARVGDDAIRLKAVHGAGGPSPDGSGAIGSRMLQ